MKYFLGIHNFTSFANPKAIQAGKNPIRTITVFTLMEQNDGILQFEIEGTGFLHNMVRIIIGTLIQVGLEKMEPNEIPNIFEAMDRQKAGPGAPAKGLTLVAVKY